MIIDSHVHIFPPDFREDRARFFTGEQTFRLLYENPKARLAGLTDLLRDMDRAGVDRAVVFGFPWESRDTYRRHNDYVMEAVARHPDRLTGLGCFSINSADAPAEAGRCLSGGMAGVGELAVYGSGFCMDAVPALAEVMEVCRMRDALLLLHTNEPVGHSYPGKTPMDLADLYAFLKAYPQNRIILAHWGGGLFFFGLLKREVRDVLKKVWFDTAASPFLYEPAVYRTAAEIVGPDRILFGSDYPLIQPGRCLGELQQAGLSREDTALISGGNAERLFFPSR
ncbi:MAG: amidohydrolase family protein [Thermodesulfobacteriota bacterium]